VRRLPGDAYLRSLAACCAISVLALLALYQSTQGLRALTFERGLRISVAEHPRRLPDIPLSIAAAGATQAQSLLDDFQRDGRVTLLAFFYTRCTTICSALGSVLQQLQAQIEAEGVAHRVRLLSLSFDPAFDTPERLLGYAAWLQAKPALWTLARPDSGLQSLLRVGGVLRMPDGAGGYRHNANLYLVKPSGELAGVYRLDQAAQALDAAIAESRDPS